MSGIASLLQGGIGDDSLVVLSAGNYQLSGWLAVEIGRGLEQFPSYFRIMCTEDFPDVPDMATILPGQVCTLTLGGDVVITGYVDAVGYDIDADKHELVVSGRGKCCDLVDCSADLSNAGVVGAQIPNTNVFALAQVLAKPFGINVVNQSKQPLIPITAIDVALGETPYEIIERAARYSSMIVYENEKGELVLDDVSTVAMASGFTEGVNVEGARVTFDFTERFSTYSVLWFSVAQFQQISAGSNFRAGPLEDKGVPRYRPKIFVSEQISPDFDYGKRRLGWEVARRYGRSQAITVRCDAWRDSGSTLWQINRLAPIQLPSWKVTTNSWLIGGVVFHKDLGGTHAELMLMPPDAFSPQPNILHPFDRQITSDLNPPGGSANNQPTTGNNVPGGAPT